MSNLKMTISLGVQSKRLGEGMSGRTYCDDLHWIDFCWQNILPGILCQKQNGSNVRSLQDDPGVAAVAMKAMKAQCKIGANLRCCWPKPSPAWLAIMGINCWPVPRLTILTVAPGRGTVIRRHPQVRLQHHYSLRAVGQKLFGNQIYQSSEEFYTRFKWPEQFDTIAFD